MYVGPTLLGRRWTIVSKRHWANVCFLRFPNRTTALAQRWANACLLAHGGANFRSFNIHLKPENAIKNKTNTDPNRTTNPNPNPTIDEAGK